MRNSILSAFSLLLSHLVFAQPVIQALAPTSGPVGSTVVIRGTGFSATPANNIVYFGAVKASVSASTDTTITVTVPLGTTYQPVSVTTNNLTGYSKLGFIVTFAGSPLPFIGTSFLPKKDFTAGIYPHSVCLADFNLDGKSDVLVSRGSANVVSIFTNTSAGDQLSFSAKLDFPATGDNHEGSAIADFDGDGKQDFVITNSSNLHSLSVYRNTTSGSTISFATRLDLAATNAPYSVAVGDLDGDGKPDLVAGNNGGNTISLFKNTSVAGNISFSAKQDINVGTNTYGVAVHDLDGDRKADIVVTCQGPASGLYILKNTTTGSFSFDAPVNHVSIQGFMTVAVGDVNSDEIPDVVAATITGDIILLPNTSNPGNLSFSAPLGFTAGNYPVSVSMADLNGDGKPELIATERMSNSLSVLRNRSTPLSIMIDPPVSYNVGSIPLFNAVGDLNGDTRPDLVAANASEHTISVLLNLVGANVAPVIDSFSPATGQNGTKVHIRGSNFNGTSAVKFGGVNAISFTVDSATGITATVGTGASGDVTVTTGYGTAGLGGFIYRGPIIYSFNPMVGGTGTTVTITGVNLTGATDVKFGGVAAASFTVHSATSISAVVGSGASGSISVVTPTGEATLAGFSFAKPDISSFTPLSGWAGAKVIINGANFHPVASNNTVFFGAVKATVTAATSTMLEVIVPAGATYQPITVTTGNMTAYSSDKFLLTFPTDSASLSTGSFTIAANYITGAYTSEVVICDFNEDGKPDIVSANRVSNNISVLRNNSSPGLINFTTKSDLTTGADPIGLATGDLDGDGKPDLVVVNFNSGNASDMSVFRNTSAGGVITFAARQNLSTGMGTNDIAIADMDGDGKPDIVVSSGNSGYFSIFKNTTVTAGAITFAPKQDFGIMRRPDNFTIADLDKDGMPDLIICDFVDGSITVFRNTSTGGNLSLGNMQFNAAGGHPSFVTTGDFDGDGSLDVAVRNYTSGTISLFRNSSIPGLISLEPKEDIMLAATNIAVADLNGDGKADLFTGRGLNGLVSMLENTYSGSGRLSFAGNVDFKTGTYDSFVTVADIDGDGKPDLVATNTTQNNVTILKNKIGDPVLTNISPASGVRGTIITITGTNFSQVSSVKIGGIAADSFAVVSPTTIHAKVGGGSSGDVTVTTSRGTGSIGAFSFIPEATAAGITNFCNGGAVTLTTTSLYNNQWYKDGNPINGATANTYIANTSGSYVAKASNTGITTSSNVIPVTVLTVPTPVISNNANNHLSSSAVSGNQWYLNGAPIAGATGQNYQPLETGRYTVSSKIDSCTSDLSLAYNFSITGIVDPGNSQYIKLYPNPVKDRLSLNWYLNGISSVNIQIMDLHGRQVKYSENLQPGAAIDLAFIPQGIYVMKIYSREGKLVHTMKFTRN